MRKIYIPGFWNEKDKLYEWKFNDATIVQKTFRNTKDFKEDNKEFDKITRKINTAINFTYKEIVKILENNKNEKLWIIWHSQWWLITMLLIINNPEILENIEVIKLLAPLSSWEDGYNFHKWKDNWYILDKKWIKIRKEFIKSLKELWNDNILYKFITFLKEKKMEMKFRNIFMKEW